MRYIYIIKCYLILALIINCNGKKEDKLFELVDSSYSDIDFSNNIKSTPDFNVFRYRNFYNGGGVGIGDINNDGLSDVYLISNQEDNKLYLNKGNFKFDDITNSAGVAGNKAWSTGVSIVDINSDGLLDLYVTNAGYLKGDNHENELFINQGNLTFSEEAEKYGLNDPGFTTHAAFFDFDLDGDLDVYILNNSFIPVSSLNYSGRRDLYDKDWPVKDFLKGGGDKFLRNESGEFVDITKESGIYGSLIGFGLGVTVGDVNKDSYPDIYISNDFFERDYLYINQQNGTFSDEIMNWMGHISLSSMGADMSDINNDGNLEIFVTEMLPESDKRVKTTSSFEAYNLFQLKKQRGFYNQYMHNTLQYNTGNNSFSEIAWFSGVAASDWSWGALMFDADNDGLKDLYISNGVYRDVTNQDFIDFFANEIIQEMALSGRKEEVINVIKKMPSKPQPNKFFKNKGDLTFSDFGHQSGLAKPSFSNGSAYGDLDNDGDLDLVVNNINQNAFLYRNTSEKLGNHSISIILKGSKNNRNAIGSVISCYVGEDNINYDVMPTRGFQSSVDYKVVLGLGKVTVIDSLVVKWFDRRTTTLYEVEADTLITLLHSNSQFINNAKSELKSELTMFEELPLAFDSILEDNYVDFFQEGLLIKMVSKEGPRADKGDVNGDGLEDIFIGAPAKEVGSFYLQNSNGTFEKSKNRLPNSLRYEDTFVKFFDVDNDRDLDLFVGSGGNNVAQDQEYLSDRIYLNDGDGNFNVLDKALPFNSFNTAVAIPIDFDNDGDLDLFVGSRSFPGVYGVSPQSFLYRNDGSGHFDDLTSRFLPELRRMGLITDAKVSDINNNGKKDLILVGEWMSPMAFEFDENKLIPIKTGLENYKGWWYSLEITDLNNDGNQDLILGNRGENFSFSASNERPVKLWLNDFDNNGTIEKIVTRRINDRDKPIFMKRELTTQLTFLKKKNLKHEDYANQGMRDLFSELELMDAEVKECTCFKSIVALNNGNGLFSVSTLPKEVQFSSVNDIYCNDLNGDGYTDLVMAGNDSGFQPQFSKLDASYGHVLINDKEGGFSWIPYAQSGLFVKGDVKQILDLNIQGKNYLLFNINERKPKLFKLKK